MTFLQPIISMLAITIKDFVAPNLLNWHTIGLRASSCNIHPQPVLLPSPVHHPSLWIDNLSDLVKVFNYG